MAEYPAGEITKGDITLSIRVDDEGHWLAEIQGKTVGYDTRAKLEAAIDRHARRAARRVEVAFVQYREGIHGIAAFKEGVATGIHGGTGHVLATWTDGSRGQVTYASDSVFLTAATEAERAKLEQLAAEVHRLREERDAILRNLRIDDLKAMVVRALDEADK